MKSTETKTTYRKLVEQDGVSDSFVHGHRAKKWRTVGQKMTYSGTKSDVGRAEKCRSGQNATLECYNIWWSIISHDASYVYTMKYHQM